LFIYIRIYIIDLSHFQACPRADLASGFPGHVEELRKLNTFLAIHVAQEVPAHALGRGVVAESVIVTLSFLIEIGLC
jgi:hypothetical protein